MPLVKSVLKDEIRKMSDENFSGFAGFPKDSQEVATRWANAIDIYASKITPTSTASSQAKQALIASFSTLSLNPLAIFPTGFTTYATALGLGMSGYASTPPPVPIILAPVFALGFSGGSAEDCADLMATIIDAWFRTGIAVNGGGAVPWT